MTRFQDCCEIIQDAIRREDADQGKNVQARNTNLCFFVKIMAMAS
jgi:hypothetical protein